MSPNEVLNLCSLILNTGFTFMTDKEIEKEIAACKAKIRKYVNECLKADVKINIFIIEGLQQDIKEWKAELASGKQLEFNCKE